MYVSTVYNYVYVRHCPPKPPTHVHIETYFNSCSVHCLDDGVGLVAVDAEDSVRVSNLAYRIATLLCLAMP